MGIHGSEPGLPLDHVLIMSAYLSKLACEWNMTAVYNLRPSHSTGEWIRGVPDRQS